MRLIQIASGCTLTCIVAISSWALLGQQHRPLPSRTTPPQRQASLTEAPLSPRLLPRPSAVPRLAVALQSRLPNEANATPLAGTSISIHALHAHGLSGAFDDEVLPNSEAIVRSLFDEELGLQVYGQSPVIRTRYGARFLPPADAARLNGPATEAHDHQTLAALGELGIPKTHIGSVGGIPFSIADVIADAVANFYLDKEELAWTAIALTYYIPPNRTWKNKFAEEYSFDDLVLALIDTDLTFTSCGGAHVLHALLCIDRADDTHELLSGSTKQTLTQAIAHFGALLVSSQSRDGSWSPSWFSEEEEEGADTGSARFLITAHLAETLLYFPPYAYPPDHTLRAAGIWLTSMLPDDAPLYTNTRLCALTHAYSYLRRITYPLVPSAGTELATQAE